MLVHDVEDIVPVCKLASNLPGVPRGLNLLGALVSMLCTGEPVVSVGSRGRTFFDDDLCTIKVAELVVILTVGVEYYARSDRGMGYHTINSMTSKLNVVSFAALHARVRVRRQSVTLSWR